MTMRTLSMRDYHLLTEREGVRLLDVVDHRNSPPTLAKNILYMRSFRDKAASEHAELKRTFGRTMFDRDAKRLTRLAQRAEFATRVLDTLEPRAVAWRKALDTVVPVAKKAAIKKTST